MAYRNYSTAVSHIVDATGQGDFTTISAAIAAASSGETIFIRPGTYTENPTLKAGVNLSAYLCDALTPNVIINGKCTFSSAGDVTMSGICLQTNGDYLLSVSGSVASFLSLTNCYFNCTNHTGIQFTSSSSSAVIAINYCSGNLATTGIAFFSHSSAGEMAYAYTSLINTGGSTTASTCSSGLLFFAWGQHLAPITTSGTSTFGGGWMGMNTSNVTALTLGGSGSHTFHDSDFNAGTASAIAINNTTTLFLVGIASTNTNAITGSGTLQAGLITFYGTSSTINTTTVTKLTTYGGTIV